MNFLLKVYKANLREFRRLASIRRQLGLAALKKKNSQGLRKNYVPLSSRRGG
jgi:hypothetical protein